MHANSRITALTLFLVATLLISSAAGAGYYLEPGDADLEWVLPPPPAPDSPEGRADLAAVLNAQRSRTPREIAEARADSVESIFRFADVMGPSFTAAKLPFTKDFFDRVMGDEDAAIDLAKTHFNRRRPSFESAEVHPVVPDGGPSYPSGHAAFAYLTAIILGAMVPEKASDIFERADRFAHNRVVGGVHFPTDLRAGMVAASVIANVMLHNAGFMHDFRIARSEVRSDLGLKARGENIRTLDEGITARWHQPRQFN
jgi:acid phosphatase (class A)